MLDEYAALRETYTAVDRILRLVREQQTAREVYMFPDGRTLSFPIDGSNKRRRRRCCEAICIGVYDARISADQLVADLKYARDCFTK